MRSTIYDVAEKSGVSIATVSRYLNAPQKVRQETAWRIKSVMDDLSYVPHRAAIETAPRLMGRIGVLAPLFAEDFFMRRLEGINQALRSHDFQMIVYTVDSQRQLEEYMDSIPITKRLDGLIVMSIDLNGSQADKLLHTHLQTVMVESPHPLFSGVETDHFRAGQLAARLFLEKWYSPCAFIGASETHPYSHRVGRQSLKGFESTLRLGGNPLSESHVLVCDRSPEAARRAAHGFFELRRPPRAIFAASDTQAAGVVMAARDRGLRVPEDVAVLGFGNLETADCLDLSTINPSLVESGRAAGELLTRRLREPGLARQTIAAPLSLIERRST